MSNKSASRIGGIDFIDTSGLREKELTLCSIPYHYSVLNLDHETTVISNSFNQHTVYVKEISGEVTCISSARTATLSSAGVFHFNGFNPKLRVDGTALLFVASGNSLDNAEDDSVISQNCEDFYTVVKPWGHEKWLAPRGHNYSLKEIFLKAGYKTSLQYHLEKEETNLLFKGKALLHFKNAGDVENSKVGAEHISSTTLGANDCVHITPNNIHRVESVKDVTLIEASTNHLDDVIRISDDSGRESGRIESEHGAAK